MQTATATPEQVTEAQKKGGSQYNVHCTKFKKSKVFPISSLPMTATCPICLDTLDNCKPTVTEV